LPVESLEGFKEISNGYMRHVSNWSKKWSYDQTFNVLINSSISLYYVTNFNLFFGVFAAYHAGLRSIWNNDAFVTDNTIIQSGFLPVYSQIRSHSNGSYFNFGVEIGYRLRGKQEEKTVH
jgi:ABC-type glycerol-3-phosphate transport system permease component